MIVCGLTNDGDREIIISKGIYLLNFIVNAAQI